MLRTDDGCPSHRAPSFTPRAFAAASAAFVRSLIASASASATAATMCSVRRFACGVSHATNSTADAITFAMKATLRAKRSSLAMTSVARSAFACRIAFASSGRSLLRPDSTSVYDVSSSERVAAALLRPLPAEPLARVRTRLVAAWILDNTRLALPWPGLYQVRHAR